MTLSIWLGTTRTSWRPVFLVGTLFGVLLSLPAAAKQVPVGGEHAAAAPACELSDWHAVSGLPTLVRGPASAETWRAQPRAGGQGKRGACGVQPGAWG